jgi:hypothetical protein
MTKGKEPTVRSRFRVGAIAVHPDEYVIIRDGQVIDIARLTMDLLVELSEAGFGATPVSQRYRLRLTQGLNALNIAH